jgi:thiol:disulfide interchange protein DsbD
MRCLFSVFRTMLCIIGMAFYSSYAIAQAFLPAEQAFAFSAQMQGNKSVRIEFEIAPNYYMYRDEFAFTIVSAEGVVQNGAPIMPAAQTKFDENFNKNLSVYHQRVRIVLPIKNNEAGEGLFKLVVTSRGCADKGLCYPPYKNQVVLNAKSDSQDDAKNTKIDAKAEAKEAKMTQETTAPLDKAVPSESGSNTTDEMPQTDVAQDNLAAPSLQEVQAFAGTQDNTLPAQNLLSQRTPVLALLFIFGLGILLSLTPCVLPMLPILSVMLAGQKNPTKKRGLSLAFAYVTGMALIYSLIGILAAQTGLSLQPYLQNPWVIAGFSILLILLALSMFDVFQLQLPSALTQWVSRTTQTKNRYWAALSMGAISALIASPCVTAPLVGIIGYIVQTGNTAFGALALCLLAYGMGVPLLLLGAGFHQFVPKSGAWMLRVKRLIGLLMVVTAVWVAQPLWGKYWHQLTVNPSATQTFQPIANLAQLNQAIAQSDKPVLVDLYADWCRSCIEMEQKTFTDPQVQAQLAKMTLLRLDMSQYNDEHAALLQQFQLYGPPAVLVFPARHTQVKLKVVGFEAPKTFAQKLEGF